MYEQIRLLAYICAGVGIVMYISITIWEEVQRKKKERSKFSDENSDKK